MELWIPVTLAAAFFQTGRFMLQKHLSGASLSAAGATFARFVYSAPLVLFGVLAWFMLSGTPAPALGVTFWAYALTGGAAQILATVCVVLLFQSRNFAVGITFKKTEVIQTVLVGWIVLGEGVSPVGFAAILLGLLGVLLLSDTPGAVGSWLMRIGNRAAGLGLLSGLLFAVSGVTYRGATLEIASDAPFLRAAVTLAAVTTAQTIAMALWLAWRAPGQMRRVWAARRVAVWVGLTSLAGSLSWFTAFTLQNAAYVNALGQVELIFSLAASVLFFREKITARELLGMAVLGLSILGLILYL